MFGEAPFKIIGIAYIKSIFIFLADKDVYAMHS